MEEEKSNVVIDRISQLPEPILHHILSFLMVKDAFRTSVLSKTWSNACETLQFLDFGDHRFFPTATMNEDQENFFQKLTDLLNVVDGIIMKRKHHNVDVQKFCLELPKYNFKLLDLKPYINKFISSITEANSIKELAFKVGDYVGQPWFTLPEVVYAAELLVKLDLGGFKLESPCNGTIKLHSLRELFLSRIHVDNNQFQLLMMGCPKIEILSIDDIQGLDHLRVFGLLNLKRIRTYNCHRKLFKIEIEAPNLEYLSHHGLGTLFVVDVAACKNLKHLTLHRLFINDKWVVELLPNLPFLENFSLNECWGLKVVRISSDRLKKLSLLSCRNLVEVEANVPNLYSFHYSGDASLSLSLTALSIEEMHFTLKPKTNESQRYENLIEFLGNFNHSKVMTLFSTNTAELIIPKELRGTLHPPLYDIKHLTVGLYRGVNKPMLSNLLDSLLWIAPCLDTLSIFGCRPKKTVQFTYETSSDDDEENQCCTSVPSKRGWHTLKKVKFVNFEDVEDQSTLRNYFVENGKLLDSIEGLSLS